LDLSFPRSLIFLSELGDKTFFIAALLAMRLGKWVSFFGSVAALSAMTVSWGTGLGVCLSQAARRAL
jgi:putative Ca2+/H+ antiporter (TMEM165/GDT1 family)